MVVRLSASHIVRLYPQEMFLVLIFTRGWVDSQGHGTVGKNMSLKNPVTSPGIDPGSVWLVAQRLNHYATPGPTVRCAMHYLYLCEVLLQEAEHAPSWTITLPWIGMECEAVKAGSVRQCLQSGCTKPHHVVVIQFQHLRWREHWNYELRGKITKARWLARYQLTCKWGGICSASSVEILLWDRYSHVTLS